MYELGLVPVPYTTTGDSHVKEEQTTQDFRIWLSHELAHNYNLGVTKEGHFALVPTLVDPGDLVAIVSGATMPLILRPSGTRPGRQAYRFIGMAYFDGE